MVVDQLSTQRLPARTSRTLMLLLLLSPELKWLSNTLNSTSPCAPQPTLSASAKRPSAAGWLAPKKAAFPLAWSIVLRCSSSAARPLPLEEPILALRRQRRSYAQIMMVLPVSKATLSRVLRRHHLNRLSRSSQSAAAALRTRHPWRTPPPRHQEARSLPSPRRPRHR